MLASKVKTTGDLMSIALQAEREAIRRYSQLAVSMHQANNESAASLFERMLHEEQQHERLLEEWMKQEGIKENTEIPAISWSDPQVDTTYNEEACDPLNSSPYKALAFAVHNEEIAFSFYTHVAAESDNKTVRQYAEILAREELGHAALLRAERRLAYHAERKASTAEPRLDPKAIHNESDVLAAAIHIDRYLAEEVSLMANDYAGIDELALKIQQQISDNEKELNDKTRKQDMPLSEDIMQNLEQLKLYNAHMNARFNSSGSGVQRLWACCDRSFAFYDAIVTTAADDSIMQTAQKLSASALDTIGILKRIIGNE
ncbi:MAG: ferritin family protein [Gammaproteobacteria bacterium]|nr:ferritin family protein [Gammaproteobacteria bacterium]